MTLGSFRVPALLAAAALAGCAAPVSIDPLQSINQSAGYRYFVLDRQAPKTLPKTAVMLAFSGGGTRASALADGALRALAETMVPTPTGPVPLATQIDVISSVSGGSVTAAAFALGGIDGLKDYESGFLHGNPTGDMVASVVLNPTSLAFPRIEILESYFEKHLFGARTYQDLIDIDRPGNGRRPYIILNATDMAAGGTFSFTQDQFDLICADLSKLKIADAVSASAAFPIALSALTIENRAPCPAQEAAPRTPSTGWRKRDGVPVPLHLQDDLGGAHAAGVTYPSAQKLDNFRRGTLEFGYLNRDGKKGYVQLLDGGLADNVGLTVPYRLLTSGAQSPSIQSWVNSGAVDKLLFVVVNARNQSSNDYAIRPNPPGVFAMLGATIGTPMDANSFQLLDKLADDQLGGAVQLGLKPNAIVVVDFDYIADAGCRDHFHNIVTSWGLPDREIDDLVNLGKAMVLQSPRYRALLAALGSTPPAANPSIDEICAPYKTKATTASP